MLAPGTYYAGFDRPMLVSDGMIASRLESMGATDVVIHDRDDGAPPVDPHDDPEATEDWDTWLQFELLAPQPEPARRVWAWLVHVGREAPRPAPAPRTAPAPAPGRRLLEIRPGQNVWLWARTDRDGASRGDAIETGGAMMARIFGLPFLPPAIDLPGGARRYAIDAARPIDIDAVQATRPAMPTGIEAWRHEIDQPDPLAINAERPWFVVVDFDWRGQTQIFRKWPRRRVNAFGFPTDDMQDLDWLLLQATHLGPSSRPDEGFSEHAGRQLSTLGLGLGVAVLLGLYLYANAR